MKNIEQRIAAVLANHFKHQQVNVEQLTGDLAAVMASELAGVELTAQQGWDRYEAANSMNRTQEKQIEALNVELIQEKAMLEFMASNTVFVDWIDGVYEVFRVCDDESMLSIACDRSSGRNAIKKAMQHSAEQDKA